MRDAVVSLANSLSSKCICVVGRCDENRARSDETAEWWERESAGRGGVYRHGGLLIGPPGQTGGGRQRGRALFQIVSRSF